MDKKTNPSQNPKPKGFFARLAEKLDQKLLEKSKSSPCCGSNTKSKDSSCCS